MFCARSGTFEPYETFTRYATNAIIQSKLGIMRRGYDPHYGSREQLRDCHEHGMKVARERDALKAQNAELLEEIEELKAMITYLSKGEA